MSQQSPNSAGPNPQRVGVAQELLRTAQLAWKLLMDPQVSPLVKLVPLATLLYIISPVDFIPEAIFGPLGLTDDLVLLLFGVRGFIALCPPAVVEWYRQQIGGNPPRNQGGGETIEGSYRVVDDQ